MMGRFFWHRLISAMTFAFIFFPLPEHKALDKGMKPMHQRILSLWLKEHRNLRLATGSDCSNCDESIRVIREGGGIWPALPSYQPYYAVGDFNDDKAADFAVALIDQSKRSKRFVLLVFNGPFSTKTQKRPAFVTSDLDLSRSGLFWGPPRPKPYHLIVGPFESEGRELFPIKQSYELK